MKIDTISLPEPINITELKNRVEVLETVVQLQTETINFILESLSAVHSLLRNVQTNRGVL